MITEELAVVQAIKEQLMLPMLETLQYIGEHTEEFSLSELRCYYKVMAEFEKLLQPA
jgi:hypothetical protein